MSRADHGRCATHRDASVLTRASALVLAASVAGACLAAAGLAHANDPVADATSQGQLPSNGDVTNDAFYGRPGSRVPIAAPPFRGLEPHLGVSLSTGSDNGFAGAGGSFDGFSTIELASSGMGVPVYDGTDIYLRDGEPMLPCALLSNEARGLPAPSPSPSASPSPARPSPSCVNGGTHAMRTETFEKILLQNDTFYVWARNGLRLEYTPTFRVTIAGSARTFRWGISRVVDTRGNSVRYTWACEGTPTTMCYPSQVSYLPAGMSTATVTIDVYREDRTDVTTFATGAATLGRMAKRLRSVAVRTGSQLARAYSVSYLSDPANGRSLLNTVKVLGYDATVNAMTGAVSGGTTTPRPVTYTFDLPPRTLAAAAPIGTRAAAVQGTMSWFADVDANGRQDYVYVASGTSTLHVLRANAPDVPSGSAPVASFRADETWGTRTNTQVAQWVTDVTGDGKADFVYLENAAGRYSVWVERSTGTQFSPEGTTPWLRLAAPPKTPIGGGPLAWLSDVNGDGRADLVYTTDGALVSVALSTGSRFATEIVSASLGAAGGRHGENGWIWLIDMNGDGRNDWVYNRTNTLELRYRLAGFDASGRFAFGADRLWSTRTSVTSTATTVDAGCTGGSGPSDSDNGSWADLNGDGKPDFSYFVGTSRIQYTYYVEAFCNSSPFAGCFYSFLDPCASHCRTIHTPPREECHCSYPCTTGTFAGSCFANGIYPGTSCFSYCYSTYTAGSDSCECDGNAYASACYGSYGATRKVLISAGSAATAEASWGNTTGGWLTDMNADRMADQVYVARNQLMVALSNGQAFQAATAWASSLPAALTGQSLVDVNGDAKPDLVYFENQDAKAAQSTGAMSPLVGTVVSELGGTTRVRYAPSSTWPNTGYVPIVPTLLSSSVDDGRGVSGSVTTTSFTYTGGLFDFVNRRFLGFHTATKTVPCLAGQTTCPTETATFEQDYGSISKPSRVDVRSGAASGATPVLLKATRVTYRNNGANMPYTSFEVGRTEYVYDPAGSGTYRAHATSELCAGEPCYDAFGNPTQIFDQGFVDTAGDETTAVFQYTRNITTSANPAATAYQVSFVSHESKYDASRRLINDAYYYYDNHDDWRAAPVGGFMTKSASWLDTKNAFVVTRFGYDTYGNRNTVTDPNGYTQTTLYDPVSTVYAVEVRNALYDEGTAVGRKQRTLTQWEQRCGSPLVQTDGNDQRVTIVYDALCRVKQINRPGGDGSLQGNQETREYHLYDGASTTTSVQNVYVTTNAPNGNGPMYSYRYVDGRGRTWQTRERGPGTQDVYVRTTFDARGNAVSTTVPAFWSGSGTFPGTGPTREFDDLGRVTKLTHIDNTIATWTYGADRVTIVDELGQTTAGHKVVEVMNVRGQVVSHTSYEGAVAYTTTYEYDARGALWTTRDPQGNRTFSFSDSLGRRYKLVDPDTGTTLDEFDNLGRVILETNASGQQTQFTYDALGRIKSRTSLYGTPRAVTVSFGYDERASATLANIGHRTSTTDTAGTETQDFNVAGLLVRRTRVIDGRSYTFDYAYDAGNRLKGTRYPDGDVIGIDPLNPRSGTGLAYDNAGHLTSLAALSGGNLIDSVTYDAQGNATYQASTNGTVTRREYDPNRGWLRGITTTLARTTLLSLVYDRDSEGKIRGVTSNTTGESWTYGYDELHRLTSATNTATPSENQSFSYDAIGNMLTNSRVGGYAYNGADAGCTTLAVGAAESTGTRTLANGHVVTSFHGTARATYEVQLTTDGSRYATVAVLTADSNGAFSYEDATPTATTAFRVLGTGQRQPHAVTCAGTTPYRYDVNGDLVDGPLGAIAYDGNHMPISVGGTTYTYDAAGERLTMTVGGATTTYPGSGYEVSSSGVTTKTLPFGVQRKSTGTGTWNTFYLHTDGQGSTRVITDRSGTVQQRISYRPYGEILTQSAMFDESLGYVGARRDGNGLLYLHARYYDPKLGRFISPDPTVSDGLNRYTYTQNNPISFVDRNGFGSFDWGVFFGGCAQSLANVGRGILNGIVGMAQMTTLQGQMDMAIQVSTQISVNHAEGDSWTFAIADAVADIPTFGLYSGFVKGPINYAYGLDPDGAQWQQAMGSVALRRS